jgi:hypothetical protein
VHLAHASLYRINEGYHGAYLRFTQSTVCLGRCRKRSERRQRIGHSRKIGIIVVQAATSVIWPYSVTGAMRSSITSGAVQVLQYTQVFHSVPP